MNPRRDDPVTANAQFNDRLDDIGVPKVLESLVKGATRMKRTVHWITGLVAVAVLLIAAVAVLAVRANTAAGKAQRAQNALVASCEVGNQNRVEQRQLWEYWISIPPPASLGTEIQYKAKVAAMQAFLNKDLVQRDCPDGG